MTVDEALDALRAVASEPTRIGLLRYGIPNDRALGVSLVDIRAIAKRIGTDHTLACQLWATGVYDARLLTAFVGDPKRVSLDQATAWMHDCDNWGLVDTLCFALLDRAPFAWDAVRAWASAEPEFVRRGSFALLASLALHQKGVEDQPFLDALPLAQSASSDPRNFVKKAVSWALRSIGHRNLHLHAEVISLAHDLAQQNGTPRWIGKDVLRDLQRPQILTKLQARADRIRPPRPRRA